MAPLYKNFFVHYSALFICASFFLKGNVSSLGIIFVSVVLHELGHLFIMKILKIKTEKMVLHAFGVSITLGRDAQFKKIVTAVIAGPVFSLILSGIFFILYPPLFAPNFCLGIINLLPVLPLDGGRVLSAVILKILGRTADRLCMKIMGMVTGSVFIALGSFLFFASGHNFSLMFLGIFVFLGGFYFQQYNYLPFYRKTPVLSDIYIIPDEMSKRKAAEFLPSDSIGAVTDKNGKVLRLVTAKGLYFELANEMVDG